MRLRLALVLALVPSLSLADDYAEAARKERERREKAKADKSGQAYTQDDLKNAGGGKGTVNIMSGPAPSSGSSSTTGSALRSGGGIAGAAPGGAASIRTTTGDRGESYWRSRAASLRQAVNSAQVRVTTADKNMGKFVYGPPSGGCGSAEIDYRTGGIEGLKKAAKSPCKDPVAEWNEQRNRAANELDAAKATLAGAQKGLDGLEEEARRAGAQPGWIR